MSAVNGHGRQVGNPAGHSGARSAVVLPPGATSHAILGVVAAGAVCARPVAAARLRVYPPGQARSQPVFLPVQVCRHSVTLHVLAVGPGTGIPGYATS